MKNNIFLKAFAIAIMIFAAVEILYVVRYFFNSLISITVGRLARLGISETKFPIEATSTPILQNHLLYAVLFFQRWQNLKLNN